MSSPTHGHRTGIVALLFGAMAAATLAPAVIGVLATFILDEFDIGRGTLGWVVAANVVVSAALSPSTGRLTDRLGGRRALIFVFGASTLGFVTLGLAPAVIVLVLGSAVSALAQAGGNPSTNKLIGDLLPRGERGVVTGIKQSGVQAGITVAGLTLPSVALAAGWRAAMLVTAIGPAIGGLCAWAIVPRTPADADGAPSTAGGLAASVRWLAIYGAIIGFAGAVTFYLPLFTEEDLGFDPRAGGAAVAVAGVVAFAARIGWARFAERRRSFRGPLAAMAILGMAAGLSMLGATAVPSLLWLGAVLIGMSTSAWNSVGMLAVIEEGGATTGRASGVVLLGFLAGLGVGPPIYGALVDATGGYGIMWSVSVIASGLALLPLVAWRRRTGGRSPRPA